MIDTCVLFATTFRQTRCAKTAVTINKWAMNSANHAFLKNWQNLKYLKNSTKSLAHKKGGVFHETI